MIHLLLVSTLALGGPTLAHPHAREIPAFARKYRTACTTCHVAPPKLNVLGEAFRLNGYRFPENDALLRQDAPVVLGQEPWKALWPRAVWPSSLPETVPLALRIVNDVSRERRAGDKARVDLQFPNEVYLLGAATFDEQISAFLEMEWTAGEGVEVLQAKVMINDPIPGVPSRAINLWLGMQNLYLFTFADRQIDRAARQPFRWQRFAVRDVTLRDSLGLRHAGSSFRVRRPQPALEINGLLGSHGAYGVGVAQGTSSPTDDNTGKDVYYRLRYKFGGLGLNGRYPSGAAPVLGGGGQLQDHAVIVEHFGYFGRHPNDQQKDAGYRVLGASARWLSGPGDVGVGLVWGRQAEPWSSRGAVRFRSVFAKAEVQVFPWLFGSMKSEWLDVSLPAVAGEGRLPIAADVTSLTPGIVALLRQNLRWVLEAEFLPRHAESRVLGQQRPQGTWMRLELAF